MYGKTVARIIAKNIEDLDYIDHDAVIACLLRKQVINDVEYEDITKKSRMEKTRCLQEKLPRKPDTAFQKFLECLEEKGHRRLALKMRRGEFNNFSAFRLTSGRLDCVINPSSLHCNSLSRCFSPTFNFPSFPINDKEDGFERNILLHEMLRGCTSVCGCHKYAAQEAQAAFSVK